MSVRSKGIKLSNLSFNSSINDIAYLQNIEKTIISSMLFNYEILDEVFLNIKYFMFYSSIHQEIVKVIENLYQEQLPIDENFIISRCDNRFKGAIEQTILEIMRVSAVTNVSAYCKDILEAFKRREVFKLLNDGMKDLNNSIGVDDILAKIEQGKQKIENLEIGGMDVLTLGELADSFDTQKPLPKIPTGIQWLDSPKCLDGGFEAPNFIFLSGEKESGKTYLATSIIENMADAGHKVGFFPLEFGSKAYWQNIKLKYPHKDNQRRINCRNNIYLESNVFDILDVEKKIRKMHKKGVRFVFIDSKLRLTHKNFKGGTLAQMLSEVFSILGRLSVELEIAILLIVQMPKENYANGKLSVKDCVDADHEAKIWINIKVEEKTGLREITMGKNKQNFKRLGVKVKFDPISHEFKKVRDLIEEKEKEKKSKKIGESGGIPVYSEDPQITEFLTESAWNSAPVQTKHKQEDSEEDKEDKGDILDMPEILQ